MAQETGKSSASISPSKQLGSCLKLLKGGTDEEVFAGLLMLTKHVKPAEFKRFRLKVLEEMQGPLFLSRVIKSGLKDDSNADLYLTIGLSVASTFCQDPICANRLKSLFPLFEEVAMEERINNESRIQALRCCLSIWHSMATEPPANVTQETEKHTLHFRSPLSHLWSLFEQSSDEQREDTFEPLLVQARFSADDFEHFAKLFERRRDSIGISAARIVVAKLPSIVHDILQGFRASPWVQISNTMRLLACGVFQTLRSFNTAPDDHRATAFSVAETLCRVAGPGWPGLTDQSTPTTCEANAKLLAHLLSVEITAQLTYLRYRLLPADSEEEDHPTSEGEPNMTRESEKQLQREGEARSQLEPESALKQTVVCLQLVDHIIHFLTVGEDSSGKSDENSKVEWSEFAVETLMALRQALIETFQAVIGFLQLCVSAEAIQSENYRFIVQSCVRCTVRWLQEETDESLEVRQQGLTTLAALLSKHPEELAPTVAPVLADLASICDVSSALLTALVREMYTCAQQFTESLPDVNAHAYNQTVYIASFLIEVEADLHGIPGVGLEKQREHGNVQRLLRENGELALDVAGSLICVDSLAGVNERLRRDAKKLLARTTELCKKGVEEAEFTFLSDVLRPFLLMHVLGGG